jgi:hypothetical protein
MALWSTLSALLAYRFLGQRGRRRDLWLSFVAAGLAAGTKYNGAPALLMPMMAALLEVRTTRWCRWRHAGAGAVLAAAAFLATTPFLLVEMGSFREWFSYVYDYQKAGQFGFERPSLPSNLGYLSWYLLRKGLGPLGGILAVAGMVRALRGSERDRSLPLVVFPVVYLVWLASYRTSFVRNLMPLVPLMAAFAGRALDDLLQRWSDRRTASPGLRRAVAVAALVVVAAWPLWDSLRYDRAIAASTRTAAVPWIVENLPPGARIATEIYGPPLAVTHPGRYDLVELWNLGLNVPAVEWFEASGVDFIISNSGSWEMAFSNPGRYPAQERIYRAIEQRFPVLKTFPGETVDPLYSSISPTIRIYDCRRR